MWLILQNIYTKPTSDSNLNASSQLFVSVCYLVLENQNRNKKENKKE